VIIVGHHGSIHLRAMWRAILLLLLLRGISTLIFATRWIYSLMQRILSALVLFVYWHFFIQFLNDYLDALIVSEQWLTIFRRDGILQYSVQQFEREKIEMISFIQNSLADKIRDKWDILIHLEHNISFRIEHIANPKKISNMIRSFKWQHAKIVDHPSEISNDTNDKFEILVETLSEVIKDYMHRDPKHPLPPRLS
jgi:hypothetical protein